jgi:hypothetical protein
VTLDTIDPNDTGRYKPNDEGKVQAKAATTELVARLQRLQERLYANATKALLIVLQGMDTSGKDGTMKRVMSGINPQGCRVVSFKAPSSRELAHDFLWRIHQEAPAKGHIGIFNRSHYEDVLVTRVHGEISDKQAKQRFGRIIGITSVVGVTGNPGQANYCASKAGMVGFSKSLAQEIASRNVTVNCVAPGFIESAMTGKLNDKQKEGIMGAIPMKRMGTGAEVASAVAYLASDEAAYVTGQTIHVNGGMAMI